MYSTSGAFSRGFIVSANGNSFISCTLALKLFLVYTCCNLARVYQLAVLGWCACTCPIYLDVLTGHEEVYVGLCGYDINVGNVLTLPQNSLQCQWSVKGTSGGANQKRIHKNDALVGLGRFTALNTSRLGNTGIFGIYSMLPSL